MRAWCAINPRPGGCEGLVRRQPEARWVQLRAGAAGGTVIGRSCTASLRGGKLSDYEIRRKSAPSTWECTINAPLWDAPHLHMLTIVPGLHLPCSQAGDPEAARLRFPQFFDPSLPKPLVAEVRAEDRIISSVPVPWCVERLMNYALLSAARGCCVQCAIL